MELDKKTIKKNYERGKAFSQITLEDDYIVPDSKPDVLKVIHTQGSISFEELKVSNQALWINGRMNFTVLYRSDNNEWKLESVTGSIPFQEKLLMDGLEEQDKIRLNGTFEDLAASIINSRKLAIRAVVDIHAYAENEVMEEIATGVESDEQVEEKTGEKELLTLQYSQKDILRIRKELELPSGRPNISQIIFSCVNVRNLERYIDEKGAQIQGEAQICVLYRGEGEESVQCYETMMPFQGTVEGFSAAPQDVCWMVAQPGVTEIEARDDYDGESRVIGVDITFDLIAKVWREENIEILEDVYALGKNVTPVLEPAVFDRLLIQNQAKVRLAEQFGLENSQEKIMQICCSCGEVNIEHMKMEENGLFAEGILKVHLLYLTSDDYLPVAHVEGYLPIEQLIEIPKAQGKIRYDINTSIDQLQVNLLDSGTYEIKAQVSMEVIVFEELILDKITDIEVKPLDMEQLQKQPGLSGYVVREGESLWDIAKAHHTTVDKIVAANDLNTKNSQVGQKLIIVKEVTSC